ncbi:MAG: transmembrane anchor protein [Gemmatimonadetes bacterium]|nr:transmembrane anchor protein [Gemmatimonadota bacterium]
MYNADVPPRSELPSSRALIKSTLIAAAVALVLLVTVILPAEYAIDPTRIGRVLGLTQMGEVKMALAREAAAEEAAGAAAAPSTPAAATPAGAGTAQPAAPVAAAPAADSGSSHVTEIALAPGQGREIKLAMREGARVSFEWTVAGGVVNFDTHADRPGTPYHGYEKGQAQQSQSGELVAAFDGMHGWFWRNRGRAPVTVTLRTRGDYQELKEIK